METKYLDEKGIRTKLIECQTQEEIDSIIMEFPEKTKDPSIVRLIYMKRRLIIEKEIKSKSQ
jgi:hypothetical protein